VGGRWWLAGLLLFAATSASAQSAYVAADVGADISRLSHSDSSLSFAGGTSSGHEAFSWDLRVGTSIGSAWGVELSHVRSLNDRSNQPFPVQLATLTPQIALPVNFNITARHHRSSFDTVVWARQRAGAIDLIYLGGLSFLRDRTDLTSNIGSAALPIPIPISIGGSTTTYGAHPLVGMEGRIAMGDHARLMPGIHVQGISGGWLIRPYVGIGWMF
jgi:hypothetical protein